jgi:hypothetical protein
VTTPGEEQPRTEVPAAPTVSTAPPRSRWRFGRVPSHLGPARTSTVVLAALFVAVFALYLSVRPDPVVQTGTTGTGTVVPQEPAPAPTSEAPASDPTTTRAPEPTTPEETTVAPEETAGGTGTATTSPGSTTGATTPPTTGGTTPAPGTPEAPPTGSTPTG